MPINAFVCEYIRQIKLGDNHDHFIGGWLIMGAPILGFQKKPLTPSAGIPTFEEVQARSKALREAFKERLIQEDPARQELRFAVLDAFEELKDSPCDKAVRQTYV